MKLLFVCTGNTCRSCMAEVIAKNEASSARVDLEVTSAGIHAFKGFAASEHAIEVMKENELDLSCHIASPITDETVKEADLVLTMTAAHKNALIAQYPDLFSKIHTIKEYVGEDGDVSDPFGSDINTYRECAEELKELVHKLILKLKIS